MTKMCAHTILERTCTLTVQFQSNSDKVHAVLLARATIFKHTAHKNLQLHSPYVSFPEKQQELTQASRIELPSFNSAPYPK